MFPGSTLALHWLCLLLFDPPALFMMNERKSLAPALVLAFLPAALVLVAGLAGGQSGPPRAVIWSVFAVCLACCFTSSFLLFRRRTGWAIAGGILLLLLNGFISFFVGCVAVVKGMGF